MQPDHKLTGCQDVVERGFRRSPGASPWNQSSPRWRAISGAADTPVFNIELRFVNDSRSLVRTFLPYALCPGLAGVV